VESNSELESRGLHGSATKPHCEGINQVENDMTLSIQDSSTLVTPSTSWTIDPSHSAATFRVRHMMITHVQGEFQKLSGTVLFDPKRPEATKIQVEIDVASISTREEKRDEHLRSADFFDVAKFPTITFVSKSATAKGADGFLVTGDLTIHGVTKQVVLEVEGPTAEQADPWGNKRIGASATTKIKRSDFGMVWNTVIEAGGVAVADEVKIQIDVSLIKSKALS
jgi:polyisoprenoid-binding protein YceI